MLGGVVACQSETTSSSCADPAKDSDGDGVPDCQEQSSCGAAAVTDPAIHPGALEWCDGKDNNCNGKVDDVACAAGSCTCGAGGRLSCTAACTACPDPGDLALAVDDGGTKKTVCAHDYAAWGALPLTPSTFKDAGDGTVADSLTGLQWQKDTAPGTDGIGHFALKDAVTYCDNLELAGAKDWRLPSRFELQTLLDYNKSEPPVIADAFTGTQADWYWTASPTPGASSPSWFVDFSTGYSYGTVTVDSYHVRCVR